MQVRDIMRSDVVQIGRNEGLTVADEIMQLIRIHYLPVADDDGSQLVGVVSNRDLLRPTLYPSWRAASWVDRDGAREDLKIAAVMSPEVVSTTPDTPVAIAARLMRDRKVGCLPVLDAGKLVGIVTEAEFVKLVSRFEGEEAASWVI